VPIRRETGVYEIRNLVNGKKYVGSASTSFNGRWKNHQILLNRGEHHSIHLQNAWTKYGPQSFEFRILVRCDPDQCVKKEQVWIDFYRSYDCRFGYNRSPAAGSTRGLRPTAEARRRMSLAHVGTLTPEHRAKMVAALRRPEVREKIRQSLLGRRMPDEVRKKIGDAHRGRQLTPEHRDKIRQAHLRYEERKRCRTATEK
jgi:group I intron endonuclease